MKISIIGLGYVGCVSLGCLAQNGFSVIGVDIDTKKVDLVSKGLPTIIEKDIDRIIAEQHSKGRIEATEDCVQAVLDTDISIICVGTPSTTSGELNLDYIFGTAQQIGTALRRKGSFHIVVIRSTVLPGTNEKVGEIIQEISGKMRNESFSVVSNPEFLREGSAVDDYYNPPFTLIGTDHKETAEAMRNVYEKVHGEFVLTDFKTAEIIKYVNNSYHALKVTFANEVGNVCKRIGIDSHEVMRLFCMDKQLNISPYYFKPGFAYGGSCLPKDLKALIALASLNSLTTPVLEAIEYSNQLHITLAQKMIERKKKRRIGVLGVAFKEGTDDLRYSPMVKVIENILACTSDYEIKAYDKYINEALLIGSNRDFIDDHTPYLESIMCDTEEEVVNWAEVVVFNRKSESYVQMVKLHPEKEFIDLVRVFPSLTEANYEGICW